MVHNRVFLPKNVKRKVDANVETTLTIPTRAVAILGSKPELAKIVLE